MLNLVDGDKVIVHSHVTTKLKERGNPKKGHNIIDIWRVNNGELEEHWDAVQPIHSFMRFYDWLTGGKFRNTNSYF